MELFRDIAAPSPTALFERAMQDEKTYTELQNGTEIVPIFNPQITRFDTVENASPLVDASNTPYGYRHTYEVETDFGIDYAAALYMPHDIQHDFYIDIDTPICTGIKGLNDEVASRLVREIGVPVMLKGPEFSSDKKVSLCRLARVAFAAANISQSFSAESSMEISRRMLADNPTVSSNAVVYGKSRGGMIGGKKYSYAQERGVNVIHYRLIDPSVGKRALENPSDVVRYGVWPVMDIAKSLPSFAVFALEGKLRERAKTIETNLAYVAGMVTGAVPSMLSGEDMGRRIPLDKGVSLVRMTNNLIADSEEYLQQFESHVNFDYHDIPHTHAGGIILPRNIRRTVRHFKDFSTAYDEAAGDETKIDWGKVHDNPKKAAVIQIRAA